jgi:hypothetical protein
MKLRKSLIYFHLRESQVLANITIIIMKLVIVLLISLWASVYSTGDYYSHSDYSSNCGDCHYDECDYECPSYSHNMYDGCAESFDDCECESGYKKSGYKCVKSCTNTFVCPPNSKRRSDCCASMADCVCDSGYVPFGNYCVASKCSWPKKPIGSCCQSSSDCEKGICGYPSYDSSSKICCPYGTTSYDGSRYCKKMPSGCACGHDSMCGSYHCDEGYCG